jgi:hypothetical protein
MMKKSNRKELNWEQTFVTLAGKNPLKLLKGIWPGRKKFWK